MTRDELAACLRMLVDAVERPASTGVRPRADDVRRRIAEALETPGDTVWPATVLARFAGCSTWSVARHAVRDLEGPHGWRMRPP